MLTTTFTLKNGAIGVIRQAQKSDLDEYVEVSRRCCMETRFLSRCPEDVPPSPESLLEFIEEVENSEKETLLVALYDGHIVGFGDITACLNRQKMKHKCDLNISILKDYWQLGIGKTMMRALIEFAREAGYEQINLNVAGDNERAIGLYEHLGFQKTGKEIHAMKHGDGDYSDFLFMTKFLKS